MIVATLPYPPTVNHYWQTRVIRVAGRHVPNVRVGDSGLLYRKQVTEILKDAPTLSGRLRVTIVANPPDHRTRDLDNILKCLLDSLTHAGLWSDDSQIDELAIVRGTVSHPGTVRIHATSVRE